MRIRSFYLLSLIILLFTNLRSSAQQFDWVTGGGTPSESQYLDIHPEATRFMCTDANGNIYAISNLGYGTVSADTFSSPGNLSSQNFLISSYTCSGQMRWAKFVASNAGGGACVPYGIVADSTGKIYVAGELTNGNLYIGNDTVVTGDLDLREGIIQFDTSGNLMWLRYVGANDINSYGQTGGELGNTLLMDNRTNDVHLITGIGPNVQLAPGNLSQSGEYDLTYDASGNLISARRFNMDSIWLVNAAAIDPVTNKLFLCGARSQPNGETYIGYVAALDSNRNVLWMDTVGGDAAGFSSILYDKMGHLYFTVEIVSQFSFNGYQSPAVTLPVLSGIFKTDTNGNVIWLQGYNISGSDVNFITQLTLLPNNLIVGNGHYAGTLSAFSGNFSLTTPTGEGQLPFITAMDTSGVIMSLKSLYGDGFYNWGLSITSDKVGNVYLGGQVADSIYADNGNTSIPAYTSVGGNTDFYIMKYGVDCGCTSMPVANYIDTGMTGTKGFTYNGTTQGVDSVVWDFGDGSATVNGMNPVTHTYDTGSYEACVYAYSACGEDMHCSRVSYIPGDTSQSVQTIENMGIAIYPNPATNALTITSQTPGVTYKLMNIAGLSLQDGKLQQGGNIVDLSGYSSGVYLIQLTNGNGQIKMEKVVKE